MTVISLYDYTGEALKPWAEAGYECYAYDIQHTGKMEYFPGSDGIIHYEYCDLHDPQQLAQVYGRFVGCKPKFGMASPVLLTWLYQVQHGLKRNLKLIQTFK